VVSEKKDLSNILVEIVWFLADNKHNKERVELDIREKLILDFSLPTPFVHNKNNSKQNKQ
jgi:hypothetical protein